MNSLTRAFADFIAEKVPELAGKVLCDESANRNTIYPSVEVKLESEPDPAPVGPGRTYLYDEDGKPTHRVKRFNVTSNLRITVKAVAVQGVGSSETECNRLRDLIHDAFMDAMWGEGGSVIEDSKALPEDEPLGVYRIIPGAKTNPVLDTSMEPILHVSSISLTVHRRRNVKRAMTQTMDKITPMQGEHVA